MNRNNNILNVPGNEIADNSYEIAVMLSAQAPVMGMLTNMVNLPPNLREGLAMADVFAAPFFMPEMVITGNLDVSPRTSSHASWPDKGSSFEAQYRADMLAVQNHLMGTP